ncbi:MAG: stage IV sporulation protein A [Clostridia bacterium]|nr:stage IV sporulation protein A [Clostridia bacterium]
MTEHTIYADIAERSGGDMYMGVVGPVRVGKSTFIRRFLEAAVLPRITDPYDRERTLDSMPQAGSGRTVMTTEPKFVPDEAVRVETEDKTTFSVRLIDCVGYMVPQALGADEEGQTRMVSTPWREEPMPFAEAAEFGTRKVIEEHSNVVFFVTCDGSVCGIPREDYEEAERRVAEQLNRVRKPYVIILNSTHPADPASVELAYELEARYGAPVALVNCAQLNSEDIRHIMELLLAEFPITEVRFALPGWLKLLDPAHPLRRSLFESVNNATDDILKTGDVRPVVERFGAGEDCVWTLRELDAGRGVATVGVEYAPGVYYAALSEMTGLPVRDEAELLAQMKDLAAVKAAYDKVREALEDVAAKGYGIVLPDVEELKLEEPEIVRRSGGYGVRLRASAQSIHMIRANIETEINPVVGTEAETEEAVQAVMRDLEEDPQKIWESRLFGKSLYEMTTEGIRAKLEHMPEESRTKLSETLEKILNEGSGGLICILL